MKRINRKSVIALLLALIIAVGASVTSFAKTAVFDDNSFTNILTVSDLQGPGMATFDRFENIIKLMKADGLTEVDSVLAGGDYSKMMSNYATPGVSYVKQAVANVFPETDENAVVCIQGNHDMLSSGFAKTGFYDMGSYCLYTINEDDFHWNQFVRPASAVKELAKNVESSLSAMISSGDTRPVIIMTHVPLHHSDRTLGGDNLYSSYLFEVINKAAEKLDIIFLFGHNHSGDYDDYIGGAVNLLQPGDTIRLPDPNNLSETEYTEAKLNFIYANCGYVGYSGNSDENGSTSKLTAGVIQISESNIRIIKYSEEGFFRSNDISRKTTSSAGERTSCPELVNAEAYESEVKFLTTYKFINYLYLLMNQIFAAIL